ncbi:30S ribosomal protein S12 methylthiotransferase RimO [Gudongella sp. SC589]|uniref:30S ribosomal protein S12 methylthiotransferase RimO n=1 Tax=Gudongella sp. SC589 TaxID=3385990 RepID=UPI003904807D
MNRKTVNIVTLGCSKNEVDSELMQSILDKENFIYSDNPLDSEVIIVNTCGFIEAAKEESIDTILEMSKYKIEGKCKHLILAGCLAQRYSSELMDEMPEVDAIMGTGNIKDLNSILDGLKEDKKIIQSNDVDSSYLEGVNRIVSSPTAYVRISEGCDNLCTYCIIPALRGKHRSRKMEDVIAEVVYLAEQDVKEVILIAQNTSDYGIDIYGDYTLHLLLDKLNEIEGLEFIRLLYLYPDNIDDKLINSIKRNSKVAHYLDMPLQHASDNVLKKMNRRTTKKSIRKTIEKLRKEIPDIVLRTTFIVGFPGETEDDFQELYDFIKDVRFDKLGVFTYSKEENTPAFNMPGQIEESTKEIRRDRLMELQRTISESLMSEKVGKIYKVLVEDLAEEGLYIGRSYMDSPEIDGVIYFRSVEEHDAGDVVFVKTDEYLEYDLMGELTDESCQ